MSELKTEGRHFIRKAKLLRLGKGRTYVGRRCPRFDAGHGVVQPFTRFLVGIALRCGRAADIEGSVVTGPIAHERLQNVEERLVARPDHSIGEVVRMWIAALTRD